MSKVLRYPNLSLESPIYLSVIRHIIVSTKKITFYLDLRFQETIDMQVCIINKVVAVWL